MIKLTKLNGDPTWFNPNHIIQIEVESRGNVTCVYHTEFNECFNELVQESPEEVVKLIKQFTSPYIYIPLEESS